MDLGGSPFYCCPECRSFVVRTEVDLRYHMVHTHDCAALRLPEAVELAKATGDRLTMILSLLRRDWRELRQMPVRDLLGRRQRLAKIRKSVIPIKEEYL